MITDCYIREPSPPSEPLERLRRYIDSRILTPIRLNHDGSADLSDMHRDLIALGLRNFRLEWDRAERSVQICDASPDSPTYFEGFES